MTSFLQGLELTVPERTQAENARNFPPSPAMVDAWVFQLYRVNGLAVRHKDLATVFSEHLFSPSFIGLLTCRYQMPARVSPTQAYCWLLMFFAGALHNKWANGSDYFFRSGASPDAD